MTEVHHNAEAAERGLAIAQAMAAQMQQLLREMIEAHPAEGEGSGILEGALYGLLAVAWEYRQGTELEAAAPLRDMIVEQVDRYLPYIQAVTVIGETQGTA
jgi:hypothetical protein